MPETTAALRLAQIGERLQGRAPALIAAPADDQRARQMRMIAADLDALGRDVEHLQAAGSRETALIDEISATASSLRENLAALGQLLATRSTLARDMQREVGLFLTLQDGIKQVLGPSILAITAAVGRGLAGRRTPSVPRSWPMHRPLGPRRHSSPPSLHKSRCSKANA